MLNLYNFKHAVQSGRLDWTIYILRIYFRKKSIKKTFLLPSYTMARWRLKSVHKQFAAVRMAFRATKKPMTRPNPIWRSNT